MIQELDTVVLTRDVPQQKLCKGDVGAVVFVHQNGAAYEVEFVTLGGATLAVVTLPADAVRAVTGREIAHVREVAWDACMAGANGALRLAPMVSCDRTWGAISGGALHPLHVASRG